MSFHYLDMASYPRRSHFEYFNSLAYPYVGLTVDVDITELLTKVKEKGLPFFLTVCCCAARAANAVPQFRQRILDGRIIEFDRCKVSHTLALEDGTYCYCTLENQETLQDFIALGLKAQEAAKGNASLEEDGPLDKFFISTLPWVSYSAIVQPVPMPADSNPRITWGKYFTREGRTWLPVSVLCHHALVDGRHMADFYRLLEEQFASAAEEL